MLSGLHYLSASRAFARSRAPGLQWLAVAIALIGFGHTVPPCTAAEPESLGEVQLSLTKLPPPPPEERRPRVAFFLIDCSSSMRKGIREELAGPNNPQRWTNMREGLQQTLTKLLAVSPGIEVRLRLFGTFLDCTGQGEVAATLNTPVDVDALMAKVPAEVPNQKKCTTTALYESTVTCIEQLREDNRQRKFEWWLFGIFSDGDDGIDKDRIPEPKDREELKKERDQQLLAMKAEGAAPPVVWIVGPEAAKLPPDVYGSVVILKLDQTIPKPPEPSTDYALELANGQSPGIEIDRAAKAGRHRVIVNLSGDLPAGAGLTLQPSIDGTSPFQILTKELTFGPGLQAVLELELPRDVDRAKGASATLLFRGSLPKKTDRISGEPRISFTFTADQTLPVDRWQLDHSPAEQRGKEAWFTADPGQAESPQWVFKGPNGEVERQDGRNIRHAFPVAGAWDCVFTCTSGSGEKLSRQAGVIKIVDANFSIAPAEPRIALGDQVTFAIQSAEGATSPATYTWRLDGKPIDVGPDSRTVTLDGKRIDRIGQHLLDVVAQSKDGGFVWRKEARINVEASPRIAIMPTEFVEGAKEVKVDIEATGEIGGAVRVFVNDKEVAEYSVLYPASGEVKLLTASIPTADLTQAELAITVKPGKEGACPDVTARLKGRAAKIEAELESPKPGQRVSAKGGRQLILKPKGDQVGGVGDVKFLVALTSKGETPAGDDLIASGANGWTVSMPRRPVGTAEVWAKPFGGDLQPEIFPDGKEWAKISSLEVVPEPQWIPFLLSLIGVLALLYFTWTALAGNEARQWTVQTTARQPQLASDTGWFDTIPLATRDNGEHEKLGVKEVLPPYTGWPVRNWFPRRPKDLFDWTDLESKNTTIYLWQIAKAHPNLKWLRQAIARNPKLPIVLRGGFPSWPFLEFPNTLKGIPWKVGSFHGTFQDAAGTKYSETHKLTSTTGPDSLWVRVKQPQPSWWERWMVLPLAAVALISAALLAHRFLHII